MIKVGAIGQFDKEDFVLDYALYRFDFMD